MDEMAEKKVETTKMLERENVHVLELEGKPRARTIREWLRVPHNHGFWVL